MVEIYNNFENSHFQSKICAKILKKFQNPPITLFITPDNMQYRKGKEIDYALFPFQMECPIHQFIRMNKMINQ